MYFGYSLETYLKHDKQDQQHGDEDGVAAEVPGEGRQPVHTPAHPTDQLKMLHVARALLNQNQRKPSRHEPQGKDDRERVDQETSPPPGEDKTRQLELLKQHT